RLFTCKGKKASAKGLDIPEGCIKSGYDHREYWQFEVCFGSNVTQIHTENGKVVSRIILGKFELSAALEQRFGGGASGRSAIVQFQCDRDANLPHITRAEEPQALHYKIFVVTKAACEVENSTPPLETLPCIERAVG